MESKKSVEVFNQDIEEGGSYKYSAEKISAQISNKRMSLAIATMYDFAHKDVLDIGCGDGTYTFEFLCYRPKSILGIDFADKAIEVANNKVKIENLQNIRFLCQNIYSLSLDKQYDVIVLRGVLHHLPDPEDALRHISAYAKDCIILEPNGSNPVLKIIEKTSQYHIEHSEQSFSLSKVSDWLSKASLTVHNSKYINLVPMFAPDWFAKLCKFFEPLVEKIPFVRNICCGQYIIITKKHE